MENGSSFSRSKTDLLDSIAINYNEYLRSMIHDDIQLSPSFELTLPIRNGRQRSDNQERSSNAALVHRVYKCNWLDGLAKTHFVGEDAVTPVNYRTLDK